jgi:hypothetical protein
MSRPTTRSSGALSAIACAPGAPSYIVRARRAPAAVVRPLNAGVMRLREGESLD